MLRFLVNSVIVAVVTTLGQMLFCSMAAYAFARIPFWGRDKLFLLYLATMMVPAQVTMIPQFILMKQFGWLDSYAGLIVPALFSVLVHFITSSIHGNSERIRRSCIYGWSKSFYYFPKVILPLAKPTFATLGILTFMQSWNSYLWPLIVTSSQEMATYL